MTRTRARLPIVGAALAAGAGLIIVSAATRATPADAAPGFELRVPERVELVAGQGGTLALAIAVDRGRTISRDTGIVLDLAPDAAVAVKRQRLGRADAVDPDADSPRFAIPLRADAAGDYTMKLHVQFWLCAARTCRPVDARRTIAVAVTAPAASAPADASVDAGTSDAARRANK